MPCKALTLAVLTVTLALGSASPARADGEIVSVTPEIGSTLTEQPGQIGITFERAIGAIDAATTLTVLGEDQKHFETSCPSVVDDRTVRTTAVLGAPGTYTITWTVAAGDIRAEALHGSYTIDWAPAPEVQIAAGTSTGPYCGTATASATVAPSESTLSPTASGIVASLADSSGSQRAVGGAGELPPVLAGLLVVGAAAIVAAIVIAARRRGGTARAGENQPPGPR